MAKFIASLSTKKTIYFAILSFLIILQIFYFLYPNKIYATGLADTDWPINGGNSAMNKTSPSSGTGPYTIGFGVPLDSPYVRFQPLSIPAIGKDALYLATYNPTKNTHGLVAFDLKGTLLWHTKDL